MKKNLLMVATVALMAAVSCNKEEVNAPVSQEGSKITVEFTAASSPDTKAALVEGDKSTPHKIKWEPNDAIAVNGEVFTTTDNDYTATFKGNVEQSFTDAEVYQAVYPAKSGVNVQTFDAIVVPAEQKAVADGFDDIVSVAYSTTTSLQFKHVTSLLRFQVPEFAEKITSVTITSETDLAGTVSVSMDDPETAPIVTVTTGEKSITLTCEDGFAEDTDYYIAVLPGEKTNLEVRINGYLSKTYATANIPVGGVANMGELPAPQASINYGIAGTMQSPTTWNAANPIAMYKESEKTIVVKNLEIYKDDEFKVVVDKKWDEAYPANNYSVDKNGLFDITFNTETKEITATCVEEYTDLKVKIKVQKNSWTNVNVHLWKELGTVDEEITNWPGSSMIIDTDGMYYYEVDGDLIGAELGIIFNNGSDQTCDLFAILSHNGLTYTLSEGSTCRLEITSSKGWNKYNIYSWVGESTKLSGEWPGSEMLKASDNVYYYEFTVDKDNWDINYIINDGSEQTEDLSIKLCKWIVVKNNI